MVRTDRDALPISRRRHDPQETRSTKRAAFLFPPAAFLFPLASLLLFSTLLPLLTRGAETAREILDRAKHLEDTTRHWADRYQHLTLRAVGRDGGGRARELEVYEKKYTGTQQRSIAFVRAPADVKGVALLAFTSGDQPAQQWLFTPETKRVRRITASLRDEGVVGTDLTYRDLDVIAQLPTWSESDARSNLRGEEPIEGMPSYVIELTPQREDIGYQHIIAWLGRDDLVLRQIEMYEQAPATGLFGGLLGTSRHPTGAPKKRFRQSDIRLVGAIPVAHRATAETPSAGSTTTIEVIEVRFDQQLPDSLFTQATLEHGGR